MATRTSSAERLRPFYGRILVLRSSVDDEQRPSGLIVPITGHDPEPVVRGVVTATDDTLPMFGVSAAPVAVGTVVYYLASSANRVLDSDVLDPSQILAYETEDE